MVPRRVEPETIHAIRLEIHKKILPRKEGTPEDRAAHIDIAELPDNDYSEALRQLPIIQEGLIEREKEKS